LLAKRKETQPIGEWSCGSTFTNPGGDHAARLIEAAGLKGFRIGDIMVSPKHANFLVNVGAATAADVEKLVAHIQETVQRHSNVALTPEFHTVGESLREPN
jgi:UDP-N-acetylmuramate dehydrogenase